MNSSDSRYNLVLTGSLLAVAILCAFYYLRTHELRKLQGLQAQATEVAAKKQVLTALVNEVLEYSKTNPSIDPILVSIGAKPGKPTAPAANPKPASK